MQESEAAGVWLPRATTVVRSVRFRRMLSASSGTLAGSAAGALLPFLVAHWFEVGRGTDVFFLVVGAFQLVAYMLSLVAESAVLPFATRSLYSESESLRSCCRILARYVFVAALPVTLLALVLVIWGLIPAAGIVGSARADALTLVLVVAPLPVLAALSGVVSAANFALDRFAFTTSTQVMRAGGGLLLAAAFGDQLGLVAVALGITLGEAARTLTLAMALPRTRGAGQDPPDVGMQMLRLASPTLLASIVIAINPIIDKAVAARLDPGAVTLLELGEKFFYIPMVLLIAAVTKVSATVWARQVDTDDVALRRDFWRVQRLGAATTVAVVLVALPVVILARDGVKELLGLADTTYVGVVVVYLVGLPLALAGSLASTMLITLRRTGVFPALAVVLVVINVVVDIVGARMFGVVGIAASSTVVRAVNLAGFLWVCDGHLRRRVGRATDAAPTPTRP